MRGVSPVLRRGVALLVLILLIAPLASAAQIGVPGGSPAAGVSPAAQIGVPIGAPAPDPSPAARIGVPGGIAAENDPSTTWELFLVWLQARLGVPIG